MGRFCVAARPLLHLHHTVHDFTLPFACTSFCLFIPHETWHSLKHEALRRQTSIRGGGDKIIRQANGIGQIMDKSGMEQQGGRRRYEASGRLWKQAGS